MKSNNFMSTKLLVALMILCLLPLKIVSGQDQENSYNEDKEHETIMVIGTRKAASRSEMDSPVPIDIIGEEEFSSVGATADITDNLNALIPSYLAAPATGDGSAFVRPTSLRGMAGDQTLVMINGKRRHRSALIQLFAPAANNGSHGVDVAMIPSIALKNVQVLRDGASAQYGSDAIAGVMNFVLKDNDEGHMVEASYGNHFEGEASWRIGANTGFGFGNGSFINLSVDTNDNEALSRGHQRPVAQELIDSGVSGVGTDAVFGDDPFVQTWGRPETSGTRFVFNSGIDMMGNTKGYFFGNFAKTKGRFRFFYRNPEHKALGGNNPDATNLDREKVAGFTPYLDGEQTDLSVVVGLKGRIMGDNDYDVSLGMGSNKLDYTLYNTLNQNAPLSNGIAQRDFDTGDYEQSEMNLNVDMTRELGSSMHLAYGLEYRQETFNQMAGEENSYIGAGSSGLAGTRPEDAGEYSRSNIGLYADLEHMLNDQVDLQYALRFENYNDFGSTINGKLAGRYGLTDMIALRGAFSTGFHAPTPGQSNLRTTTTTFGDDRNQIDTGHFPAGHDAVKDLGSENLTEEKSLNMSVGAIYQISKKSMLTLDYYNIGVEGKIYRAKVGNKSFYTNAMDIGHSGIDLVYSDKIMNMIDVSFAYNMNTVEVSKNREIDGKQVVSDDLVEDIENNYPSHKFTLTTNTAFMDHFNLMSRVRYIGSHYDERGTIDGLDGDRSREIDGTAYLDIEVSYKFMEGVMEGLKLTLGGSNILDTYPTEIEDDGVYANRWNVGLPYPRRSVANYEGGAWYLKASYLF